MIRFSRRGRFVLGGTLAGVLTFVTYLLVLMCTNNMHEVLPGELYRSAQLTPQALEQYRERYGFKSIINLRGSNEDEELYANSQHVTYINFPMSSKHELTPTKAAELIALMRNAPKPLLIHCRQGADRSGLAAALYLAAISKQDEEEAEWQLSPFFGHLPWISAARAMDETFEKMEPSLGYVGS